MIEFEKQLKLADSNPKQIFAILFVNGEEEILQLDSGTTLKINADITVKKRYAENGLMTRRKQQ